MKDPETKKLFQESHNRIKTMALIHENLYRSTDYARIDFSSYLDELISDLLSSYGRSRDEIAVDVSLEVTHLDLNMAVPCGLIANELISNALKHAFPGARRGKIAISLGRADGQEYEFSVSDDGIGSPEGLDLKNAESFGFQLIYGLATHQMRGTAELKRGKGTTVTIRFPDLS
jgi:two-component sensor histidine kinase